MVRIYVVYLFCLGADAAVLLSGIYSIHKQAYASHARASNASKSDVFKIRTVFLFVCARARAQSHYVSSSSFAACARECVMRINTGRNAETHESTTAGIPAVRRSVCFFLCLLPVLQLTGVCYCDIRINTGVERKE